MNVVNSRGEHGKCHQRCTYRFTPIEYGGRIRGGPIGSPSIRYEDVSIGSPFHRRISFFNRRAASIARGPIDRQFMRKRVHTINRAHGQTTPHLVYFRQDW